MIGKTDLIQHNKKINFDVQNKRRVILLEEICFPSAISVSSECFQAKYSRNLLGAKYDSSMVTFNSCTDTRQISAAPNSRRYLILLAPFWKMMSYETFGLRFLCEIALLSASFAFSRKTMRYADETLSFHDSAIRATQ